MTLYRRFGKRLFDVAVALPALIVLSPVLAGLALAVRVKLGSSVFFRQVRPGLRGKPFTLVKFRTMTDACDAAGILLPDSARLTPLGRVLRASSLDELPELINVVRGEMSFVGPRPLLMQYLARYTPEQARRQEVRPGITGWAQVNGRQTLLFSQRMALDVWYVDNVSLTLDLKILLRTVRRVATADDVISGQDIRDVDDLGLYQPETLQRTTLQSATPRGEARHTREDPP